jgi:hypothetical protein
MKRLILLSLVVFSSCEFISNQNQNDIEPGFNKLPCDNILETKITKYPKMTIDSLINIKLKGIYSKDSIINYHILGNLYHSMSLDDCKIDKSSYNVVIKVTTTKNEEVWQFILKYANNKMRVINFYKPPSS